MSLLIRSARTYCFSLKCSGNQALQLFIPSRLTGDEDFIFSLSEDLKQLFFSFLACPAFRPVTCTWVFCLHPRAHIESQETVLPTVATTLLKRGNASFRPSEPYTKTKRHTNEMKEHPHSEKGHHVQTVTKIEGFRQASSNSKGPVAHVPSFLYFLSPHPSPSLSQPVHGERKACLL